MQRSAAYNQIFDPLILYAQATVVPGAGAGPNVAALMNPHGLPMQLLEIRWRVYPLNNTTNFFARLTGMSVGVKLDLGSIPVCDAEVPVNSFGTSRDDDEVPATGVVVTSIVPNPDTPSVSAYPDSYRWRLKYPLYIPAGGVLTPTFSHLGQNHFPVVIDTVYVCRTLPAKWTPPTEVRVPWVGSYNSISFDNLADQDAGRDFSSELDIVNPYRQPLELSRLTGRVVATFNGEGDIQVNIEDRTDHRFRLGKFRARARSGDEIARAPTPFNGLWPYGWRAWDIPGGWSMRPGEFYKVQLTVGATDTTAPADAELGRVQYSVTAIGYRKLPLAVFSAAAAGA